MSNLKNTVSYAVLLTAVVLAAGAARSGVEPLPGIPTGPWEVGALGAALALVVRIWPQPSSRHTAGALALVVRIWRPGSRHALGALAITGVVASAVILAAALPRAPWAAGFRTRTSSTG